MSNMDRPWRRLYWLTAAVMLLTFLVYPAGAAVGDLPAQVVKIPPMVREMSVSTYIPSEVAPGNGIAVNVIYPNNARYPEGAPVVVTVPGGDSASGLEFSTHAAQSGFIEVRFAFPGGGKEGFASAGIYDLRGPHSQSALRDVLLFAAGKTADTHGRLLAELVPVKVYNPKVGVIGWSNGGNLLLITLDHYASELQFVGWVVFYETPIGSMFYPPALGGPQDLVANRHYRLGSSATGKALVDYRKLKFQTDVSKSPGSHKRLGQPEITGILYFDENRNGNWEESIEFALPYSTDLGLEKQIYPPDVTLALSRLGIFGEKWPNKVATFEESQAYFQLRDGSLYLRSAGKAMPGLAVIVFGSQLDHLQRQSDHGHIALNYNGWLVNRSKFVRLNPDPAYVGQVSAMNPRTFIDNKPNSSIDATDIEKVLEPEGLLPDYVFTEAACAELSDRVKLGNFGDSLKEPLVTYSNGALEDAAGEAQK